LGNPPHGKSKQQQHQQGLGCKKQQQQGPCPQQQQQQQRVLPSDSQHRQDLVALRAGDVGERSSSKSAWSSSSDVMPKRDLPLHT
jgi:hypothetical protein